MYYNKVFHRLMWQYGTCSTDSNTPFPARRHRFNGHVQFVLWPKGTVHGSGTSNEYTYTEDYWHDMNAYWWNNFIPSA